MSQQDALRSAVSKQDHTTRPTQSQKMEDEHEELPSRLPSSGAISTADAEDHLVNSQEDSTRLFSLQESPVAMSYVVMNQYAEPYHSSSSPLDVQPKTNTDAIPTLSPHTPQQTLSGLQEPNPPMNHVTRIGTADETVAQFPASCPMPVQSSAHKPSHPHPRNSKQPPNLQSPRLQYITTSNTPSKEAQGATETGRRADFNYAYDSEAEEDLAQSSRSAAGIATKQEDTDIKSKFSETGQQTKKVEINNPPPRNQLITDACDAPNCRSSAHRISANDTTVGKSGSFSTPGCNTNVKQVRPGSPGKGNQRPPSPGGPTFKRREISPKHFSSAVNMTSSAGKRSKIPRLVQKSAKALAVSTNPATPCDNWYPVYNVFSIIVMRSSDDRAEPLDSSLIPTFAAESVVEEEKKCSVFEHRSYLHPAVQTIQTYEPVRISIKPSETVSAVISVEEPKVVNTLLNVAKPEKTDTHLITMTEFRDAVRVYEPVLPTNKLEITEETDKDEVISADPSPEKAISKETSTQTIVSIIPSVVLASAHVKKQKNSKSVQAKAQNSVQSSSQPVVQSSVRPVQPAVQTSVQPAVQTSVQPAVQSSVKSAVPGRKTNPLAPSIIEVSFTDLDKKAFQPHQPKTTSGEQNPNPKTKIRTSKGHSQALTTNESKTETASGTSSREEVLNSESRNALKAILRALFASSAAEPPGNQKESSNEGTDLHRPSSTTVTSPFVSPALSSVASGLHTNASSVNSVSKSAHTVSSDRTTSGSGENLSGQYPLGSSVTQIFSKHRKHHRSNISSSDNGTSWSKALYAKTLYFQDETKQNLQKQTNRSNPASSTQMPPAKTKPSSKSERSSKDKKLHRDHFQNAEMQRLQQAANVPSESSVSEKLDEPFATLEKTVNNIILSRFGRIRPIQITS